MCPFEVFYKILFSYSFHIQNMALHWLVHTIMSQRNTMSILLLSITLFLLCPTNCYGQNTTETVPVSHITKTLPVTESSCYRTKKFVDIETGDGCEPYKLKIPVCTGACDGETRIVSGPPHSVRDCRCCSSRRHSVRKRTLHNVVCHRNGNKEILPEVVVYLAIPDLVDGCGCIYCRPEIGADSTAGSQNN